MVSFGPKLEAGIVTFLSMPTAFPNSMEVTWKGGGGGAGGGAGCACTGGGGGGAGGGLLQADKPTAARRPSAPPKRDIGTFLIQRCQRRREERRGFLS